MQRIDELTMNSIGFAIQCNFPQFCGMERTKEASDQIRAMKEELLAYRAIGTLNELKALKEQAQKKWCDYCKDADSNPYSDLRADDEFSRDNKFYFCPMCGRKLDGGGEQGV